ncbi:MAG: RNA polymerase sigma-70 factor [Mucilaginibacter sp.]|jgi:RNA polymerase sigma-70 factor (ECF subfamily)|uniref:RNA polymerase sigma-70 factor n=1 Tax=Mucilaginibacter sp. TaxID=1882438 RepID=UPI00356B30D6
MTSSKTLSDIQLTDLLKVSDHSAFNEIYERYFYLVFTHAYKKLRDEEQAKDVVQDVFATLWFKRETNLPAINLAGYLFTAVRNKIFDLFAHEKVTTKYFDSLSNYLESHSGEVTDHRIREKQLEAYIERSVQQLPPKMKLIFEMSRKENLSHKDIAQQLGTSENNVSKQLNNALRVLKTKLSITIFALLFVRLFYFLSQIN